MIGPERSILIKVTLQELRAIHSSRSEASTVLWSVSSSLNLTLERRRRRVRRNREKVLNIITLRFSPAPAPFSDPLTFFVLPRVRNTRAIHLMRSHFLRYRKNVQRAEFMLALTAAATLLKHFAVFVFVCDLKWSRSGSTRERGEKEANHKWSLLWNCSNPIIASTGASKKWNLWNSTQKANPTRKNKSFRVNSFIVSCIFFVVLCDVE